MAIKKTALAQSIAVLLSAATCSLAALAQEQRSACGGPGVRQHRGR